MNRLEKAKIKNLKIARTEKMQSKDKEVKNEPSEDPEIKNESISEIKNDTTSKHINKNEKIVGHIYTAKDGTNYTYKLEKRKTIRRDGEVIERQYKIKHIIKPIKEKRGPKIMVFKKKLRGMIKDLSDLECEKLIKYYEDFIKQKEPTEQEIDEVLNE